MSSEYEDIAYVTQEATREKHRQPQTTEGSPIADSKSPPIPESIKERIDAIGNGVTPTDGTPRVHTEDSPTVGSEGYPLPYSNEERIDGTASGVTPKKGISQHDILARLPLNMWRKKCYPVHTRMTGTCPTPSRYRWIPIQLW